VLKDPILAFKTLWNSCRAKTFESKSTNYLFTLSIGLNQAVGQEARLLWSGATAAKDPQNWDSIEVTTSTFRTHSHQTRIKVTRIRKIHRTRDGLT